MKWGGDDVNISVVDGNDVMNVYRYMVSILNW
jgi:hypothetical protein